MSQVVAGIIENSRGEILLAQRPPGKRLEGLWEFPGGKIENGESPEEALARELKEELELDVEVLRSVGLFPHSYEWGAIDLHVFVVKALSQPRTTKDVHVFKWVTTSEVPLEQLAPADVIPFKNYLSSRPKT